MPQRTTFPARNTRFRERYHKLSAGRRRSPRRFPMHGALPHCNSGHHLWSGHMVPPTEWGPWMPGTGFPRILPSNYVNYRVAFSSVQFTFHLFHIFQRTLKLHCTSIHKEIWFYTSKEPRQIPPKETACNQSTAILSNDTVL